MLSGKRILLIISGGIAAYKSLELIRELDRRGAQTRAIMTESAGRFVTPLSVASLTGDKVYGDLFSLTDEAEMGHIELSRAADLVVVAPATANIMAKMAAGLADDLATTALLATDKPVMIAPSMNVRMWRHAATRRNLHTLKQDGIAVIGPGEGDMACGEYGPGRMAEPAEIVAAIVSRLSPAARPLSGKRILVTAGPTHEPIDPVRYLANRSSGKQGYAIARAAAAAGAEVALISGPTHEPRPDGVAFTAVETAADMLAAVEAALPCDVAIMTAAVADWRPEQSAGHKIKKSGSGIPGIALKENQDILKAVSTRKTGRPGLVIGFAAETQDLDKNAAAKLKSKACDWIVANDVSPASGVMGGGDNEVTLITGKGAESWARMSKADVAGALVARIADHLKAKTHAAE